MLNKIILLDIIKNIILRLLYKILHLFYYIMILYTFMNCSKGEIMRKGYSYKRKISKKEIKVKPLCIQDRGKIGKGPKLIKIPSYDVGLLSKYNYSLSDNKLERQKALKRANRNEDNVKVLRHINALRILNKSNEKIYKKIDYDYKYLQYLYQK
jgi:hypothetical protein